MKTLAVLVASWVASMFAFVAVQQVILRSSPEPDMLRAALDRFPLTVPPLVCSVAVVLWLKHRWRHSAMRLALPLGGIVAAVVCLPLVLFVISGAWVALLQGKQEWTATFVEGTREVGLLLLAQGVVFGGAFGAAYSWVRDPRTSGP